MDKKTGIIIILSLIIISLVWIIFTGKDDTNPVLEALREQRIEFDRSTEIIELENSKLKSESKGLRSDNLEAERNNKQLESENTKYRVIIDRLTEGSEKTEEYLSEYGSILGDFAEFLRQAGITD